MRAGEGMKMRDAVTGKSAAYLHSPTFWTLMISAPVVWGLVYYLLVKIFSPALL